MEDNSSVAPVASTNEQSTDSSLLANNQGDVSRGQVDVPAESYDWVPPKFLKDGQPDYKNLAKSYQALESKMGKHVAPTSIEEYTFESKMADQYDPEVQTAFKAEALEKGMTAEQYAFVMNKYEEAVMSMQPSVDDVRAHLEESWGPQFEANLQNARAAWDAFAPKDVDINEIGNNPAVLKFLAQVGKEMGEDRVSGKFAQKAPGMTIDEVNALIGSKDYATNQDKQRKVQEYYEKQFPG